MIELHESQVAIYIIRFQKTSSLFRVDPFLMDG